MKRIVRIILFSLTVISLIAEFVFYHLKDIAGVLICAGLFFTFLVLFIMSLFEGNDFNGVPRGGGFYY